MSKFDLGLLFNANDLGWFIKEKGSRAVRIPKCCSRNSQPHIPCKVDLVQGEPTLVSCRNLMKGVEECLSGHAPCREAVIK